MQPETWTLLSHSGNDVIVERNICGRITVWNLAQSNSGWKVFSIMFSNGKHQGPCKNGLGECWDRKLHRNGIRLTLNRIDRILMDYCEGRRV